jgi:D-alanyl-D-alanine carboxypeptidase/D-alanyl-D-alanine-endopeptidase (penicillin-binding protein 4)
VKGRVKLATVPSSGTRLMHVAMSDTLDVVLKRLNKISSNFIAEMLLKTMGAELKGAPGSFAKGIEAAEDFLEKDVGIPRGTYVMKNGSGLNDANRYSASQVNRLLRYMYDRFPLQPEYLSSMGIAGKDGTLRYRFEGSDAVGRLRAKTGTLENVSALSGYVQAVGGEKFIFSTMVNDYAGKSAPVIQSIDALGVAIAASGSAKGPGTAVAELTAQQNVASPLDEAKARIKTYLALGRQSDVRNIAFLRTAWRSEKDPAVRAVVAESMYRSNPQDYLGARALLDSLAVNDDVYGRLRKVAKDMSIDVPGVGAVVELAAEGNSEALGRLLELTRASAGDEGMEKELSMALAEVARTAPDELLRVLRNAAPADRDTAVNLMARGLVQAADAEHPFWPALRKAMGAVEPGLSAFARQLDGTLSVRIAQEKAPKGTVLTGVPVEPAKPATPPSSTAETRPGG